MQGVMTGYAHHPHHSAAVLFESPLGGGGGGGGGGRVRANHDPPAVVITATPSQTGVAPREFASHTWEQNFSDNLITPAATAPGQFDSDYYPILYNQPRRKGILFSPSDNSIAAADVRLREPQLIARPEAFQTRASDWGEDQTAACRHSRSPHQQQPPYFHGEWTPWVEHRRGFVLEDHEGRGQEVEKTMLLSGIPTNYAHALSAGMEERVEHDHDHFGLPRSHGMVVHDGVTCQIRGTNAQPNKSHRPQMSVPFRTPTLTNGRKLLTSNQAGNSGVKSTDYLNVTIEGKNLGGAFNDGKPAGIPNVVSPIMEPDLLTPKVSSGENGASRGKQASAGSGSSNQQTGASVTMNDVSGGNSGGSSGGGQQQLDRHAQFTLIVNVPFSTSRQDLIEEFSEYGTVELAMVVCNEEARHPHKEWTSTAGYAFVRFSRRSEAMAALRAATENKISIRGNRVRADWAKKDSYTKGTTTSCVQQQAPCLSNYDANIPNASAIISKTGNLTTRGNEANSHLPNRSINGGNGSKMLAASRASVKTPTRQLESDLGVVNCTPVAVQAGGRITGVGGPAALQQKGQSSGGTITSKDSANDLPSAKLQSRLRPLCEGQQRQATSSTPPEATIGAGVRESVRHDVTQVEGATMEGMVESLNTLFANSATPHVFTNEAEQLQSVTLGEALEAFYRADPTVQHRIIKIIEQMESCVHQPPPSASSGSRMRVAPAGNRPKMKSRYDLAAFARRSPGLRFPLDQGGLVDQLTDELVFRSEYPVGTVSLSALDDIHDGIEKHGTFPEPAIPYMERENETNVRGMGLGGITSNPNIQFLLNHELVNTNSRMKTRSWKAADSSLTTTTESGSFGSKNSLMGKGVPPSIAELGAPPEVSSKFSPLMTLSSPEQEKLLKDLIGENQWLSLVGSFEASSAMSSEGQQAG